MYSREANYYALNHKLDYIMPFDGKPRGLASVFYSDIKLLKSLRVSSLVVQTAKRSSVVRTAGTSREKCVKSEFIR